MLLHCYELSFSNYISANCISFSEFTAYSGLNEKKPCTYGLSVIKELIEEEKAGRAMTRQKLCCFEEFQKLGKKSEGSKKPEECNNINNNNTSISAL